MVADVPVRDRPRFGGASTSEKTNTGSGSRAPRIWTAETSEFSWASSVDDSRTSVPSLAAGRHRFTSRVAGGMGPVYRSARAA